MKKQRLTPFSGSLFRLAWGMIGGVAVLAAVFAVVEWAPVARLRKSTASYDTSSLPGASMGDQRFLEHATALHHDLVALSELAQRQAPSEQVRAFADRLLAELRGTGGELARLADARGRIARHERGAATALARATPKNFDDAYLSRLVDAHAEAVDLFERAATQCDDPELRAFAIKALPAFQAQHAQAKQLRKTIG